MRYEKGGPEQAPRPASSVETESESLGVLLCVDWVWIGPTKSTPICGWRLIDSVLCKNSGYGMAFEKQTTRKQHRA